MCGPKPLFFGEKLGVGGSLSIVGCCSWGGFYNNSVSQLFLPVSVWIFSQLPDVQESLN